MIGTLGLCKRCSREAARYTELPGIAGSGIGRDCVREAGQRVDFARRVHQTDHLDAHPVRGCAWCFVA